MKKILSILCLVSMFTCMQFSVVNASGFSDEYASAFELYLLYDDSEDLARALSVFKNLARQGHADSLDLLVEHYSDEEPDYYQAIFWLNEYYRHGHAIAMVHLGDLYAKSDYYPHSLKYFDSFPKDLNQAFECYQRAAKDKNEPSPEGMIRLAYAYKNGDGVTADQAKALNWLEKGVSLGVNRDESVSSFKKEINLLVSFYAGEIDNSLKNLSKEKYWRDYEYMTPALIAELNSRGQEHPAQLTHTVNTAQLYQGQRACTEELENYFTHEASLEDLQNYFAAQYELTAYRIFGSVIASRVYQHKRIQKSERVEKIPISYTEFVNEYLPLAAQDNSGNMPFLAAKRSFETNPLSLKALAQLAPFLQATIVRHTAVFGNVLNEKLMLDEADFVWLKTLAYVEENRGSVDPNNFLHNIDSIAENGYISDIDASVNIPVLNDRRITVRKKQVELFWKQPKFSKLCDIVRKNAAREFAAKQGFVSGDGSFYSIMSLPGLGEEIVKTLHNAILIREDMWKTRHSSESDWILYVGKKSPWGSIEEGTFRSY